MVFLEGAFAAAAGTKPPADYYVQKISELIKRIDSLNKRIKEIKEIAAITTPNSEPDNNKQKAIANFISKHASLIEGKQIFIEADAKEIGQLWVEAKKDKVFLESFIREKAIVDALRNNFTILSEKVKPLLQQCINDIATYKAERMNHVAIKGPAMNGRVQPVSQAALSFTKIGNILAPEDKAKLQQKIDNFTASSPMFTGAFSIHNSLEYGNLMGAGVSILAMEPALNSDHKDLKDVALIGTPDSTVYHGAHVIHLLRQNAPKSTLTAVGFPKTLSDSQKKDLNNTLKSIDLINLSIASDGNNCSFDEVEYLLQHLRAENNNHCLLLLAASNDSYNCGEPLNPNEQYLRNISHDNEKWNRLLLVCSLTEYACPAFYSNRPGDYGPFQSNFVCTHGTRVFSMGANSSYERNSGTSMATPGVAGCIALLIEYIKTQLHQPLSVNPEFLKDCVLKSADRNFYITTENFAQGFDLCIHVTENPSSYDAQFYQSADGKILVLIEEKFNPAVFGMGILNIENALMYAKAKLEGKNDAEIRQVLLDNNKKIISNYIKRREQKIVELPEIERQKARAKYISSDMRALRLISPLDDKFKSYTPIHKETAPAAAVIASASPSSSSRELTNIRNTFWEQVMEVSLKMAPDQNDKNKRYASMINGTYKDSPFAWIAHNQFKSLAHNFFMWITSNPKPFDELYTSAKSNIIGSPYKAKQESTKKKQGALVTLRDILLMFFPLVEQFHDVFQWLQKHWLLLNEDDRATIYLFSNPHNALDLKYYLIQQVLFSNNQQLVQFFMQDLQKNSASNDGYRGIIEATFDIGGTKVPLLQLGERCLDPKLQAMTNELYSKPLATKEATEAIHTLNGS